MLLTLATAVLCGLALAPTGQAGALQTAAGLTDALPDPNAGATLTAAGSAAADQLSSADGWVPDPFAGLAIPNPVQPSCGPNGLLSQIGRCAEAAIALAGQGADTALEAAGEVADTAGSAGSATTKSVISTAQDGVTTATAEGQQTLGEVQATANWAFGTAKAVAESAITTASDAVGTAGAAAHDALGELEERLV